MPHHPQLRAPVDHGGTPAPKEREQRQDENMDVLLRLFKSHLQKQRAEGAGARDDEEFAVPAGEMGRSGH